MESNLAAFGGNGAKKRSQMSRHKIDNGSENTVLI